jgi:Flp pilus assembly protein TadG
MRRVDPSPHHSDEGWVRLSKPIIPLRRARRGAALIYGVVALVVGLGLCSLAVDYGHAQYVRTELQSCADGAARAAAAGLPTGRDEARTRARFVGSHNRANGQAVTFADDAFRFGKWNTTTAQLDTSAAAADVDAVEVTARRTVPLAFLSMFGQSSVNVSARATGRAPTVGQPGFIGLNGIEFKNTAYVGSYYSSVTTSPGSSSSGGKGTLGTNDVIGFKNNATISGDLILGPVGSVTHDNGLSVSGGTLRRSTPITAPASPAWSPGANPNGVPQNYTVNSNTTLPGGTYWFTSITVNKRLTFSGPATVYVNGDIHTDDAIVTYASLPSNLKLYQLGPNRVFDAQKDLTLIAEVHAPTSELVGNNKLYLYGSGLYKSILAKNSADFYFDLDSPNAGRPVSMVY